MSFEQTLQSSIKVLLTNKVRTFLTMLGVIIGVFSVISLVSVGTGFKGFIGDQFNALGSGLLFVAPGKFNIRDDPAKAFGNNKLEEKHVDLVQKHAGEYLVGVTPSIRVGSVVKYKTNSYSATVSGVNENARRVLDFDPRVGKYFDRAQVKSAARVALIGDLIQKELFGSRNSIGERIEVNGEKFEVIGVLEKKNRNFDEVVLIPYTAAKEVFDLSNFSNITVKVKDPNDVRKATIAIELAMLRDLKKDDFSVLSQAAVLSSIQSILGIVTAGISAIAGISLVVGGIGIMNIMLVSVTERTREIGLRKALGATNNAIAFQFLTESVLISALGGVIGIILGYLLAMVLGNFVSVSIPASSVVLSFSFSLGVGVLFGTYPAISAGKKDPIEALRYE